MRKSASVTLTLVAAAAMTARGQQAPAPATPAAPAAPAKQQACPPSTTPAGGASNSQTPQNCSTHGTTQHRGGFGFFGLLHSSGG
ncbi:MAG TPA: hypothetical protein VGG72_34580 [Bryobacteraceae bacterium]